MCSAAIYPYSKFNYRGNAVLREEEFTVHNYQGTYVLREVEFTVHN